MHPAPKSGFKFCILLSLPEENLQNSTISQKTCCCVTIQHNVKSWPRPVFLGQAWVRTANQHPLPGVHRCRLALPTGNGSCTAQPSAPAGGAASHRIATQRKNKLPAQGHTHTHTHIPQLFSFQFAGTTFSSFTQLLFQIINRKPEYWHFRMILNAMNYNRFPEIYVLLLSN